jgi:hypothetical protein
MKKPIGIKGIYISDDDCTYEPLDCNLAFNKENFNRLSIDEQNKLANEILDNCSVDEFEAGFAYATNFYFIN